MPNWYSRLAVHTLPTIFVMLQQDEIESLSQGDTESDVVVKLLPRLNSAMSAFSYSRFVTVDLVAPTDTERFRLKRGKVVSAKSAWSILSESEKVRESARIGMVSCLCVQPFRTMDVTREFRLFVRNGKLVAMSQYWLIRHFHRLERRKESYLQLATEFIDSIAWSLPLKDLVVDVYIPTSRKILIMDLNPWGAPTDPLMLNSWDRDWNLPLDCHIVQPPFTLSGDVNVGLSD